MLHKPKCWLVIGVIDAYGAIHYHKIMDGERNYPDHAGLWPHIHHKRWRFKVSDWECDKSPLAAVPMEEADYLAVLEKMRKVLPIPRWVAEGEAWEAAGRPRGKAYDRFLDKWEKANPPLRSS